MYKGQFEVKGRYRPLVCVLTGTHHQEEVIEQALHVARNHRAEISMLLALDELPPNAQMIMQSVSYLESTEAMEVMAKHWLDDQVSSWDTEVPINASVTFGSQTANIIALVEKTQADLVMKQADDDVLERWFGNDDVNLLRQCPCPVWITHQGQAEKYNTIVAAVDLNPRRCCAKARTEHGDTAPCYSYCSSRVCSASHSACIRCGTRKHIKKWLYSI